MTTAHIHTLIDLLIAGLQGSVFSTLLSYLLTELVDERQLDDLLGFAGVWRSLSLFFLVFI